MTVIIYASCYQQNEGRTPSADPKGNLFSDPFRATRITVSALLLEIRRVCFFFQTVSKDFIFVAIDSRIFRFYEIRWILSSHFFFRISILRLVEENDREFVFIVCLNEETLRATYITIHAID